MFLADNDPRLRALRHFLNNRVTNLVIALLIIASCVLLVAEASLPRHSWAHVAGYVLLALFAVEIVLRMIAASSRAAFIRNYWVDVTSILPLFLPGFGILRILRLLRLFRLGALLVQGNRGFGRIYRQTTRQQFAMASIILVVVTAVTLVLVELEPAAPFRDVFDTFFYSLLSLIAGEPQWPDHPVTSLGKFFTLVLLGGGFTVFALFTGTVSAVVGARLEEGSRSGVMDIEELFDHIIVCGWNRSGRVVLEEIGANPETRNTAVVIIAEARPEFSDEVEMNPNILFLSGDYTTPAMLKRAKVERAATAILLADRSVPGRSDQDRDARTILAALMIEKFNPQIFTCAELLSRNNEEHLRLAGIEEVVIGDEYSATILATSSRVRGVTQIADEIFSNKIGNQIYKREVLKSWIGKSFLDLQGIVKSQHDALVIAVESAGQRAGEPANVKNAYSRTITNPPADYVVGLGDKLIVLAHKEPKWS